jgi:EAL domain-containing protein (putative c-di-GMP-specific phosphodiesterase class I)
MLNSLGVVVSLDNFGRDGVSLTGLAELPLGELKIDRTLTRNLGGDERLVRSAVALARSLDLRCIVSGVETATQLGAAVQLGADAAQGYLLARPVPAADLAVGLAGARRRVRGEDELADAPDRG